MTPLDPASYLRTLARQFASHPMPQLPASPVARAAVHEVLRTAGWHVRPLRTCTYQHAVDLLTLLHNAPRTP